MASAGVSIVEPSGPALQPEPEPEPKHESVQEERQDPEPEVRTGSGLATPVVSRRRTPESRRDARDVPLDTVETLEIPDTPEPFDWDDFEQRFEQALRDADENEKQILKEVENLSMSFRAWASAASARDDERAAKRLQTRRRFVNISEDRMEQKQRHYTQVVKAFESALALLKS